MREPVSGKPAATEPRQYALVVARWPVGEWVASVVEDDLGLRVLHLHHSGCADGSCGVDTARLGWTVAEAIAFAEGKRDEMLAGSLPYWGPPQSIETFIEPTGDAERLEARIRTGPEPPPPMTPAANPGRGVPAAGGMLGLVILIALVRSWSALQWTIVGITVLAMAAIGLVALAWTVWQDREVIRCWHRAMAEADERQRERVTTAARRLRATGRPSAPRLAA